MGLNRGLLPWFLLHSAGCRHDKIQHGAVITDGMQWRAFSVSDSYWMQVAASECMRCNQSYFRCGASAVACVCMHCMSHG